MPPLPVPPLAMPLFALALAEALLPPAPPAAPLPAIPPVLPLEVTLLLLTVPFRLVVAVIVELLVVEGLLELLVKVDAPLIAVPFSNALPLPMVCDAFEFSFACGLPLPPWVEVAVAVWALTVPGPLLVFVGLAKALDAPNVSAIAVDMSVLFILVSPLGLQSGRGDMPAPVAWKAMFVPGSLANNQPYE